MFGTIILIAIICQLIKSQAVDPYSECSKSVQCFGLTADYNKDCLVDKDCIVLLTTKSTESGIKFTLFWSRDVNSSDSWVAAGLSSDDQMGDDSVTEFILKADKTVSIGQGLTFATDGDFGVRQFDSTGISDVRAVYSDGSLSAQWTRDTDITVDNINFNLEQNQYYILLAFGPTNSKDEIQQHSGTFVSPDLVTFKNADRKPSTTYITPTAAVQSTNKQTTTLVSIEPTSTSKV